MLVHWVQGFDEEVRDVACLSTLAFTAGVDERVFCLPAGDHRTPVVHLQGEKTLWPSCP